VWKSQLVHVSEFRRIGDRESGERVVQNRKCRDRDRENPDKDKEKSALTYIGFRGSESTTLDH
jgi:hypothetical protein